eukprot:589444-Rhodomonas_salina.1
MVPIDSGFTGTVEEAGWISNPDLGIRPVLRERYFITPPENRCSDARGCGCPGKNGGRGTAISAMRSQS